ncbi:MAG: outer membrane beta-barrel domain-containing protein [Bdellovibrionota bacterium]
MSRSTRFSIVSVCTSLALGLALALTTRSASAQESSDDIENLFSKEEQAPAPPAADSGPERDVEAPPAPKTPLPQAKSVDVKGVGDLGKLAPFNDVAVIQKRYLPRTGRFEFFGAPTMVMNDAFFLNFGLDGRFAYYFQERYGLEFVAFLLTVSERQVTTDLREKRSVTTRTIVSPKSYMGLDFKWTPIYGKMTFENKRITPFDLYFAAGLGSTTTNQGTSEPTLHLGTGQTFALSKASALRWDFSWNFFTAPNATGSGRGLYNNLYLSMGMSFFFPEATYR